jgi:hypothetical protein
MCLQSPQLLKQLLSYSTNTPMADYFSQEYMAEVTGAKPVLNFVLCCNFYLFGIRIMIRSISFLWFIVLRTKINGRQLYLSSRNNFQEIKGYEKVLLDAPGSLPKLHGTDNQREAFFSANTYLVWLCSGEDVGGEEAGGCQTLHTLVTTEESSCFIGGWGSCQVRTGE